MTRPAMSISSIAFSPITAISLYAGIGAFSSFRFIGSPISGLLRSTHYGDPGTWGYLSGNKGMQPWAGTQVSKVFRRHIRRKGGGTSY